MFSDHFTPRTAAAVVPLRRRSLASFGLILASLVAGAAADVAAPARADAIGEWQAQVHMLRARRPPASDPVLEQIAPMVALAMYDAVVAIDGGFRPYLGSLPASSTASAEAAAHAAGHAVLTAALPADRDRLDRRYADALSVLPADAARTAGVEVGEASARRLLAAHPFARPAISSAYRPLTEPGRFVPPQLPAREWLVRLPPFLLLDPTAFRLPGPPSLDSVQYANDYAEVLSLGSSVASGRNAEQTQIAQFWHSTDLVGQMLPQFLGRPNRSLAANARVFAMQAVAEFDMAPILVSEKYGHNFWRPVTAVRNGDRDGNAATTRDATWEPLLSTPAHPDYPCGHCLMGAMTAAILATEFGVRPPGGFTVAAGAPGLDPAVRQYADLDVMAAEISDSRIWGGVHFRSGAADGAELGRRIAAAVAAAFAPDSRTAGGGDADAAPHAGASACTIFWSTGLADLQTTTSWAMVPDTGYAGYGGSSSRTRGREHQRCRSLRQ